MKKLFIILLFCCANVPAQTFNEIKKLDTIYFYFSNNANEKKDIYKDNNELIRLKYSKFEDFDAQIADKPTYKKYHKKRFLKKNKYRLITINFLNSLNFKQLNEFVASRRWKTNFIIDEAETRKREILVRRAFVNLPYSTDDNEEIRQLYPKRYLKPFYEESGLNDDFYTFIIPKKKIISATEDLYILFEPSKLAVKEDAGQHEDTNATPRVKEQYTFKLSIKKQVVFFQLTHQRKESQVLEKKYDLFTKQHETISFEDLNSFSEKQLEELFARARNIYIVENFTGNNYVIPLLVKPTSDWVDFVKNNND